MSHASLPLSRRMTRGTRSLYLAGTWSFRYSASDGGSTTWSSTLTRTRSSVRIALPPKFVVLADGASLSNHCISRAVQHSAGGTVAVVALRTVGHGTLGADAFAALLAAAEVAHVVNIRSFPGSRHNPQFGREEME